MRRIVVVFCGLLLAGCAAKKQEVVITEAPRAEVAATAPSTDQPPRSL